jgi:single-strand DNA-binding protein
MNHISISGYLLRKPDIRYYGTNENKICVANYILVSRKMHTSKYKDEFNRIRCEARGSNAEFAEKYLDVNKHVGIDGYLDTVEYIDGNGKRRTVWKIIVERQEFLERKMIEKCYTTDNQNQINRTDEKE